MMRLCGRNESLSCSVMEVQALRRLLLEEKLSAQLTDEVSFTFPTSSVAVNAAPPSPPGEGLLQSESGRGKPLPYE